LIGDSITDLSTARAGGRALHPDVLRFHAGAGGRNWARIWWWMISPSCLQHSGNSVFLMAYRFATCGIFQWPIASLLEAFGRKPCAR